MGSDTIIILPRPAYPLRNIMVSDPIIFILIILPRPAYPLRNIMVSDPIIFILACLDG